MPAAARPLAERHGAGRGGRDVAEARTAAAPDAPVDGDAPGGRDARGAAASEAAAPEAASRPDAPTIATVGLAAAPSWLSQRLEPGGHPEAVRAVGLARETFISGRRIDMGALAGSLGVDRTSLFRWVGNRDALLSEVLWSLAVPTLVRAEQAVAGLAGAELIAELLTHFVDDLARSPYFREFTRREPGRALRLLTTTDSEIQRRYVATIEYLVRRELGAAPFGGAIGAREFASLIVRVSESFTYADQIAGEPPSAARARTAFRVLLRAD